MQVIGHRGAAALAPENTWAGFDRALALGVDAIETDVQATSDGVLVLIHDLHLDRTTDGHGPVASTPWSALRELDAGSWFGQEYRGAQVPLLDECWRAMARAPISPWRSSSRVSRWRCLGESKRLAYWVPSPSPRLTSPPSNGSDGRKPLPTSVFSHLTSARLA